MAHGLDEDFEGRGLLRASRQFELMLAEAAVECANERAVHEHLGVVVQVGEGERAFVAGGYAGAIGAIRPWFWSRASKQTGCGMA